MEKKITDIVRIDKNIANNSDAFDLDFQSSDELASSLLMYVAWQRKNTLFDFGIIDPANFAQKMGFSPRYLTSKHPHPAHLEGLTPTQIAEKYREQDEHPEDPMYRIFDSRLENALYLLITKNFTFRRSGIVYRDTGTQAMKKLQVNSIRLLKSFSILFKKSPRGKKKLYYEYELDSEFAQNLSLLYITTDLADFTALRKKSLHKLYLHVRNLRENAIVYYMKCMKANYKKSQIKTSYVAEFDLLCRLAGVNCTAARDRKRWLNNAFKTLENFLPISLEWEKSPGSKWAYIPVLHFKELQANSQLLLPDDKLNPIQEKVDIFTQNLFLLVIEEYKEKMGYHIGYRQDNTLLEQKIMRFFQEIPVETIGAFYLKAQMQTFTRINDASYYGRGQFCKVYKELTTYNQTKETIKKIFTTQEYRLFQKTKEDLKNIYKEVMPITQKMDSAFISQKINDGYTLEVCGSEQFLCK